MYFRALKFLSYFIEMALFGLFGKTKKENLNKGLEKTKESVFKKLARVVVGKSKVDDEVLDNLEEVLITSDVGVETTVRIIERIEERVQRDKYMGVDELNRVLKEEIVALLKENTVNDAASFELPENGVPYVIMVVGVNGVGKTTTIGKLAYKFKEAGKKVVLGAADTFRAAAVDQLVIWADRVGVPIVKQAMGADPASVAYDTLSKAKADGADVVIIDTAGRLHNKINLMNELTKIKNVMKKVLPEAPNEVLLVLDAHELSPKVDIFTPCKFRVKARGQLQQRADTSVNRNLAGGRICYARNHLEDRRLACTVLAEQRDRFPLPDRERKIVDRDLFLVFCFFAEQGLEPLSVTLEQLVYLRHMVKLNDRFVHHQITYILLSHVPFTAHPVFPF